MEVTDMKSSLLIGLTLLFMIGTALFFMIGYQRSEAVQKGVEDRYGKARDEPAEGHICGRLFLVHGG